MKIRKSTFINFFSLLGKIYLKFILALFSLVVFYFTLDPLSNSINHNYSIGDIALRDIEASTGFYIEKEKAEEKEEKKKILEIPLVYDFDSSIQNDIMKKLKSAFELQLGYQLELELNKLLLENIHKEEDIKLALKKISIRKDLFLKELGIDIDDESYELLLSYRFAPYIFRLINDIIFQILVNGVVLDKGMLLKELDKGIILRDCLNDFEERIWDLKAFYELSQAKSIVRIIGDPLLRELDHDLLNLIVDLSQKLIKPNIILNREESERRRGLVLKSIGSKLDFIKSGEMVIREGEPLNKVHLLKLKALGFSIERDWMSFVGALAAFIIIVCTYYLIHLKSQIVFGTVGSKDLIFLTAILLVIILTIRVWVSFPNVWNFNCAFRGNPYISGTKFGIPLTIGSMIVCLVLGAEIAYPFALLCTVIASMLLPGKFENCIYFFLSSIVAIWYVKGCRERRAIIKVGVKLGLFCSLVTAIMGFYSVKYFCWSILFLDILVAFLGSVCVGVAVIGLVPVIEIIFRYTTDITLLELANLDRPILRRLMLEAPGTYHHSVVVGTMVEAAASEIGANSLLGKVCGYYHDIGKLKQPLYFVENQIDRKNKHDKLSPYMSSLVLISHVKHGIEIAKTNNLGDRIVEVIRQHHGSSLISYFFRKAQLIKGTGKINISDFRYPGPIPQTVEGGLVMLADVIEAASRTLVNPTSSRIQGLVQDLINEIFSDGQLNACDLTLKDLNNIAKSFNKILSGIYHHRVEYRKFFSNHRRVNVNINGRVNDAGINKQYADAISNSSRKSFSDSSNTLKRLGLS